MPTTALKFKASPAQLYEALKGLSQAQLERLRHLGELARLRRLPLRHLMNELGIVAPEDVEAAH